MEVKDTIGTIVNDVARQMGYMVYEWSVLVKGPNSQVIVRLDHEKGISHDDCEAFSKELTRRMDSEELLPNYTLEVSSPGLKRKLRSIDEFARFSGAPVKVVYDEGETRKTIKGTLRDVSGDIITVMDNGKEVQIAMDSIAKANLEY